MKAVSLLLLCAFALTSPANEFEQRYNALLLRHVDDRGGVDYTGLQTESREELRSLTRMLEAWPAEQLPSLSDNQRLAFWINAYNLLTLELIVRHHPIPTVDPAKPAGSILQIPDAWKTPWFKVAGNALSLDDIEHQILRKEFREPLLHMGLVCASRGCPVLRREAYTGERVLKQLTEQTRAFLAKPENCTREGTTLALSPLFDWFGEDFEDGKGAIGKLTARESALLRFVGRHVEEMDLRGVEQIRFLPYDWSLNHAPTP